MEHLPRPHFAELTPVPLRGGSGVTIRATQESNRDPVFEQSASVDARRRLYMFSTKACKDASTATEDEVVAINPVEPPLQEENVVPETNEGIQETAPPLPTEESPESVPNPEVEPDEPESQPETETETEPQPVPEPQTQPEAQPAPPWWEKAKAIATRINQQIAQENVSSEEPANVDQMFRFVRPFDTAPQNMDGSLRRTRVNKHVNDKKIPPFVQIAKTWSEAAGSKIDPKGGNLLFTRRTKPAEQPTSRTIIEFSSFATEPIVPTTDSGDVEPTVQSAAAPTTSASPPPEQVEVPPPVHVEKPLTPEEEARKAARLEWLNRAKNIKQRIPAMMDDTRAELKREALAQIREQHKNSGSLVSQLTKNATLPKPTAEQKRSAYKSFAAAPSHFRDTWLPKPEPPVLPTFGIVEKRNSNSLPPAEVSSQVFRSKSNVTNPEEEEDTSDNKVPGVRNAMLNEMRSPTEVDNSSEENA